MAKRAPSRTLQAVTALLTLLIVPQITGCSDYRPVKLLEGRTWSQSRKAAVSRPIAVVKAAPAPHDSKTTHRVRRGETLGGIAQKHGIQRTEIIAANKLRSPYVVREGQRLAIPRPPAPAPTAVAAAEARKAESPRAEIAKNSSSADDSASMAGAASPAVVAAATTAVAARAASVELKEPSADSVRKAQEAKPPPLSGEGFLWPVKGRLISSFGDKPNGQRNDGINISAPVGSPVRAAENGIVVYAGDRIMGFGQILLIRHADGFTTAYAHNDRIVVSVGEKVRRGQIVAQVGSSGDVRTPQLHFELRNGTRALDPAHHLEPRSTQVASR